MNTSISSPIFPFRLAETPWGSWPASMAMKNARCPGGATGCVFGGWDAGFRTCSGRQESLKNGRSLRFFWNGGVPPNHLFIDRIFPDHPFKWYFLQRKHPAMGVPPGHELGCPKGYRHCWLMWIPVHWKLVGGLEHVLFFHSVGNVIIPTDEVIFFRGVGQPPTRKVNVG